MPLFPFDLDELARRMAEMNVHPDMITQNLTQSPRMGDIASPNPMSKTPVGGADTAGSGGFWDHLKNFFGNDPATQDLMAIPGQIRAFSPHADPTPTMNTRAPVSDAQARANMAAQPIRPPAPVAPLNMSGATSGGTGSLGALMTPNTADRPGMVAPNTFQLPPISPMPAGAMAAPNSAPVPLTLSQQPAQQAQPVRPGIERPESATSPHMNADATGVENTVMQTFYAGGIKNPFALAVLASTAKHESGFSPANLARTWSDPSQSGHAGTSGGLFSFRNERLTALQDFAKANGEEGNGSPATQAKYFMHESPDVITALDGAKSIEEAQAIMNKNIAFAGYDQAGGEAGRRLQTSRVFLPQMEAMVGQPPTAVDASVTPPAADAAATVAPTTPTATPVESFADRLGKLGQSIKAPPPVDRKPPSGTAPLPQPGGFSPNPQAIQLIMSMLGGAGGQVPQVSPTLGQLLGGK